MKTQTKTKWLEEYVNVCRDLIPTKRITAIYGYKVAAHKFAATYGSCVRRGNRYTINMRLYRYDKKAKEHIPMYLGNLLENFAHELAHTREFEHSPEHVELTGKILSRFARVLKKRGISDTYKVRLNFEDIK